MQSLTAPLISQKKVLLRYDLDVPVKDGQVVDDFRLEAGLDTLDFCLQHASSVVMMGHLGRPQGEDPAFSVKPIVDWFEQRFAHINLPEGKFHILENLRFEAGEDNGDPQFAQELASYGEVFIMEAFAAHHQACSTTILPTLMPHAAGFNFAEEVKVLEGVRNNPTHPLVVIIGGAKLEDKLPAVLEMAKFADAVLVGGKIALEIKLQEVQIPSNVLVGKLNLEGSDLAPETTESWKNLIMGAKMVVWNGPLGKIEEAQNNQTQKVAEMVINSGAKTVLGGGDTVGYLDRLGLLNKFSFVSTGGGAMLELLIKGTLPTIEALK